MSYSMVSTWGGGAHGMEASQPPHWIGIRDWRQVLSTMLINISKADFGILDVEDEELLAIHEAFSHSQVVGKAHYSLQTTNALAQISHTAVTLMQRAIMSMAVKIIDELRNIATGMGNGILRGLQDIFGHHISVNPAASIDISEMISLPHLAVNPNLLDTLWPLFLRNPNPSFTSSYQVELMQSCLPNEHVLCVLPTGSGKSLAFFAAPLIHPHTLLIVITPLVAFTKDMAQQLATTHIEEGQYPHIQNIIMAQIVIVSVHQAGTDDFFHWAQSVKQRLMHVFIDEAYHIFTLDNYHNCFKLFHLITALTKPITFLTATMSPISLPRLCSQMQISPLLYPLHSSRKRLSKLQEKDRGIIYCTTIALIKELSELLNILYYMSRLNDQLNGSTNTEEKNRRFNA
ncbi:hypothetical protein F4604DRAFT_1685247 [Suillus subluteus]|nr:hypothetical protein F4604DRAFT_1685247 [Suillus subluteus]